MNDVNKELWKLGVPAKTQHNEVAPAQHELAPIYEGVNQAVDHNQIVMETLKKVAGRHGMACLLHEKPFAGVNGSGKHDNWSLTGDDGTNLLNPGDTPHENIQFLLVLACIIKQWISMQTFFGNPPPMWEMTTDWEPTRRRLPSYPFSWESSLRM